MGSPPLARDKFVTRVRRVRPLGITPACAGQITIPLHGESFNRDHPRLRGTNYSAAGYSKIGKGSPPLARDKCYTCEVFTFDAGITPACAGQIASDLSSSPTSWDHPRLRGTNL